MKKIFIFLTICSAFFYFLFVSYGNSIHSSYGDTFFTLILSIDDDIPFSSDLYTIEYDESLITGIREPILGENVFWQEYITEVDGLYARVLGLHDFVNISPNTRVKIHALFRNEGEIDSIISKWVFFASRKEKSNGNWCNFVIDFERNCFLVLLNSNSLDILAGDTVMFEAFSVEVANPIEVVEFDVSLSKNEFGELIADTFVKIKNNSDIHMQGVEYVHQDVNLTMGFEPNSELEYTYVVNYGRVGVGSNTLESFNILVPAYRECAVYGTLNMDQGYSSDSRFSFLHLTKKDSLITHRIGDLPWYPEGEAMCIEIIEHNLKGEVLEYVNPLVVSFENVLQNNIGLSDDVFLEISIGNIGDEILEDIFIDFNYEKIYQTLSFSSCTFSSEKLYFATINPGEDITCEIKFVVDDFKTFLKFRYDLVVEESVVDTVFFHFSPDLEISLNYIDEQIIFSSTYENSALVFSELFEFRGVNKCKRYFFLDLKAELCTL